MESLMDAIDVLRRLIDQVTGWIGAVAEIDEIGAAPDRRGKGLHDVDDVQLEIDVIFEDERPC